MKVRIYVPYGINRLMDTCGPCGAYLTLTEAQNAGIEYCDNWKVATYDIEVPANHEQLEVK